MSKYVIVVISFVVIATTIFAASAFTSSEIVRDSTIGVEADNNALVSLVPGTVGDAVKLDSSDQLIIDTAPSSATGLNARGTFKYGNASSPTSNYAFSITNADTSRRNFTLGYNNVVNLQGASDTVQFRVHDGTGQEVGIASPSSSVTFTATSGQTHYIVLEVDTRGLDLAADLSGDLEIRSGAENATNDNPINNPIDNGDDILQNPSFESPGGWDFSDTNVQRSSSSDPSFDGNFSASMEDLTQSYDGRILESNPINITGSEYYDAEIYYNIQGPNSGRDNKLDEYSVKIVWLDDMNNELSANGIFGDFSNLGGSWKDTSFSKQAPASAESAKLRIRAKEGDTNDPTVYWDLASLNEFSNQLSNPSFESSGGWDFSGTNVQRSSSSDPSFEGNFSASMEDLTQSYGGRILESDPVSVNAGERYQFGAYYNIQAPNGGRDNKSDRYSVEIVWLDSSGAELSDSGFFGDFPSTGGSWTKVDSVETAPSGAESAKLRIRAKEGDTNDPTVYWDSAFIKT